MAAALRRFVEEMSDNLEWPLWPDDLGSARVGDPGDSFVGEGETLTLFIVVLG